MSTHVSPRARDTQSLHYILRSGLAGGLAGCVAKTVVAPLDRVKILFQASNPDYQKYAGSWSGAYRAGRDIYQEAGVRGLFQGHSATLLRIFPYAAIKFMTYDQIAPKLMPTPEKETNVRRFIAGATSGVMSVFFTYPLDLIRVRMAFQTNKTNTPISFIGASRHIYNERAVTLSPSTIQHFSIFTPSTYFNRIPLLKFYRGFTVTITGMIPYAGVSFLCWGYLRSRFLPSKKEASPTANLAFGAVAGAVAQTASYPFEVIRRRMQVGGITQPDRWLRWGETVRAIWQAGGWRGFYVGLTIGYLKVVPMTAVSFTTWQGLKRLLDL
ncbi:hypothetical protein AX16_010614 [Volvariella volvacea WC 439]|nr:hypothetical protein AX16_010614 [Volvariella volvacea WC 439]